MNHLDQAPKAEKAPKPEKAPKIEQNDVVRPKAGTGTGKVWDIADQLSAQNGSPAGRKEVLDATTEAGINVSTAATQYGKWRKFHGLKREVAVAAPAAEAPSTEGEAQA